MKYKHTPTYTHIHTALDLFGPLWYSCICIGGASSFSSSLCYLSAVLCSWFLLNFDGGTFGIIFGLSLLFCAFSGDVVSLCVCVCVARSSVELLGLT